MDASKDVAAFDPNDEGEKALAAHPASVPPPPPQPPIEPPPAPTDDGPSYLADAAQGLVHGAESAVRGVRQTARGIAKATGLESLVGDEETNAAPLDYATDAPQTVVGQVTADITQAAIGYGVGSVALRGAKALTGIPGAMAQSAVGTPLVADQDRERLSNVLMQYPWLEPAASLLAQDPTDAGIVSKAKAAVEDVMMTGAAGVIFKGLHLAFLKATGKGTAAEIDAAEKALLAEQHATEAAAVSGGAKDLTLDSKLPSSVLTTKGQVAEYKQVSLKDGAFAVREADHLNTAGHNPIEPDKIKSIQDSLKKGETSKMPPVDMTTDPLTGEIRLLDGRHRVAAARAEGYETITAKVLRDKTAPELLAGMRPPITLKAPDGAPVVTLTPAKQAKFESVMNKLVIKDAVSGTPDLAAGPAAKKGSMNPAYMDSPNNILKSLEELGKLTKKELGESTPAYRSVDETKELAGIMGQDHTSLIVNLKASNASLENIDAIATGARQYLQLKGAEMFQMARKATHSGDPEAKAAFAAQYLHLSEFQAELSQMTTRLGRGLRSFGESVGPFDATKLKASLLNPEEAANFERIIARTDGNVDQIAHILKMQQMNLGEKLIRTHNEVWMGLGLLSRFATQSANLLSTAFNSILMEPGAMLIGGIERGVAGKGWAEAREAVGIYSGFRTAFFDSMTFASKAAKTDTAILSPSSTAEHQTQFVSALTWNMNPNAYSGKFIDIMGQITRASFRGLTAGDEFFKQLSYRAKISATASREAVDMVRAGALPKNGIAGYVEKALQEAIDTAGAATNNGTLKYAEKATFVSDIKGSTWFGLPSAGEEMARLASHPVFRGTILPFVKTPTNVTRTAFEYTPLIGQLRKQFWTDMGAGGEKAATAIGKLTIGSGMYVGAMHLVLDERITGAPPGPGIITPKGWKPYSIKFTGMGEDGGDLYISYQRMQPFGDILGLTADFAKSTGMLDNDTRDGVAHSMSLALAKLMHTDVMEAGGAVGASYAKSLISKTYFRNLTEFFSTFSGYNNENAMMRWMQNYAASHVPGALSQFNNDDTVREVRSMMDAINARIPGRSQTLPPKRDYFGEIHDTKVGFPFSIISPFAASETKADPVMQELTRLSQSDAAMKFSDQEHFLTIGGQRLDLKKIKNADGVTAYDRMGELMQTVKPIGESLNFHDKLQEVRRGPRYKGNTESAVLDGSPLYPGLRQNMIRAEEADYRKAALDQVMQEYKQELGIPANSTVQNAIIDEKIARKKVGVGLPDKLLNLVK